MAVEVIMLNSKKIMTPVTVPVAGDTILTFVEDRNGRWIAVRTPKAQERPVLNTDPKPWILSKVA